MRLGFAAAFSLLLSTAAALSQSAPFDMSPERSERGPTVIAPNFPIAPQSDAQRQPSVAPAPQPPAPETGFRRYLVPSSQLVMAGEIDRRSWSVSLTQEQAESAAELHIGYQNAVVAAPELSTLRILINNSPVIEQAVGSPNGIGDLHAKIPAGLLKPGANTFSIETELRHRTDCTIESTYELWTEIDPAHAFLTFDAADAGHMRRIDDIASLGPDERGETEFTIVMPSLDLAANTAAALRLAEGLALMAKMPNQTVRVVTKPEEKSGRPGHINVLLGTPAELAPIMRNLPSGASMSSVATFVNDPELGPSTLVVSGPTWNMIASAIETIVKPVDRAPETPRTTLNTGTWRFPDPPMFNGAGRATFDQLGASTEEFSGRRFRTSIAVGIPSDFYAYAYGEARLLLDAAYSQDVLPGSRIDIYVNGNIATTMPITRSGGGILRHFPVGVTMRHFRPGANIITIEAVLRTAADATCAPGATGLDTPRFALFDTSEFSMPQFARIGRRPDLSGISGTGFPYNRTTTVIPLLLEPGSVEALSAAATFLARMSVAAGRLIPVDPAVSPAAAADRNAIFVGSIGSIQPQLLAQLGISDEAQTGWGNAPASNGKSDSAATNEMLDRWKQELSGSGWRGSLNTFKEWFAQRFDIMPGSLRLRPQDTSAFMPGDDVTLLMTQRASPAGNGTWTAVTAPNADALAEGMRSMVQRDAWDNIAGQVTTFKQATQQVNNVQVGRFEFVATQPPSFSNYRLIAANWLSANTLSYASAVVVMCMLLGVATYALLSAFGRRD